jgi:hypothetical protein
MSMLVMNKALKVLLGKVRLKKDSEGGKWATLVLTIKLDGISVLKGQLVNAYRLMTEDTALDAITTEDKLANVRVTFQSGAGTGRAQVFNPKELTGFTLHRETATQAGTLKKDRGTGVELEFAFTVPLDDSGSWVVGNFGDELLMQLEKLQGDLPLEETGTDSQDARNQRVIDDEEAEAPEVPEVSEETAVAIARKKKKPSKAKK